MRQIICINCPIGCRMTIFEEEGAEAATVTGHRCPRGEEHARRELSAPVRVFTALMRVSGYNCPMSVKTSRPIAKEKIFECAEEIRQIELSPPIRCGDVLIKNICGTGADIIATRELC